MPAGSVELTNARKLEIVNACAALYLTKSFKDISIKEIGANTSFTRTSIYNYFETKEEIFLSLLTRELDEWVSETEGAMQEYDVMSDEELATFVADSFENHQQLLKIMSMNPSELELSSRPEVVDAFKAAYNRAFRLVEKVLYSFKPVMGEEEREEFTFSFFLFLFGVYANAMMSQAESAKGHTTYELIHIATLKMLRM